MSDVLSGAWSAFLEDVKASRRKLLGELGDLHADAVKLSAEVEKRYAAAIRQDRPRGRTAALRTIFEADAASLLLEPLERHARARIHDRLPRAFEDFWSDLADAARKAPIRAEAAPAGLIETLPEGASLPFFPRWFGWRNRVRALEVRQAVLGGLKREAFKLGPLEGRVYMSFAQAALALLEPWKASRAVAVLRLRGGEAAGDPHEAHAAWKQQVDGQQADFEQTLESLDAALEGMEARLLGAVLGPERLRRLGRRRARRLVEWESYWGRQQSSIRALVEAEISLIRLGARSIAAAEDGILAVRQEHRSVADELQAARDALERWQPGRDNPLPPRSAHVTAASEHTRQWKRALGSHAQVLMPAEIESVVPRRPLPGWRVPWRAVRPQQSFLNVLDAAADPVATVLEDVEGDHKAVLREIERAREVVTFGIQAASESGAGGAMAQESVGNSAGLLKHAGETFPDRRSGVEAAYVQATASCFYQYHVGFEHGRLSLLSFLAREGLARGTRRASSLALEEGRRGGLAAWTAIRRFYHAVLVRIGWEAPLDVVRAPVQRRRSFHHARDVDLGTRRLPLIYGRLFRTAPVEDVRFLVGREAEMSALADARALWDADHYAAVLVFGQRGSGKTSLINCALTRSFTDVEVVRGQFSERVVTAEGMRRFLAGLLGVGVDELSGQLSAKRRVIVIEELERTFLRKVGGLTALEELLRVMTVSAHSTLWVLSLAAEAFEFLDAAANLRRYFSHRINASAVRRRDLREAILQRHNLSGLRIEFAGPPDGNRFSAWFNETTGIREDTETAFFEAIYKRSGGVFRSAIELWQRNIDRAEGGVLYMHFPEAEDHADIASGFTREELFTLQMLMQHGSLTPEEHAGIFGWDLEASRMLVEHLLGCRIVEVEPGAPGVRVRPQATVLVRSALSAQNLL